MKNRDLLASVVFLSIEAFLYALILTVGGILLVISSFGAILLCFLFSLLHFKQGNRWIILALSFTVFADFFLVLLSPMQQLWGMVCFLCVQTVYAVMLTKERSVRSVLFSRVGTLCAALLCVFLVLGEKTDLLAVISLIYYATLILNIVHAFFIPRRCIFAVALILFLLCDTVVGLQVAAGGYLPISEGSFLYQILFSGFNLAWFFYLPSQVLIALCSRRK